MLLVQLEDWVKEQVAKYADDHNEQIPNKILEGFQHSMRANVEFHKDMADNMTEANDLVLAEYHNLMSKIYKKFMYE